MTEKEIMLQKEVERLQKKVKALSEAYNKSALELEKIKSKERRTGKRGRPGLDKKVKAQILALAQQGKSMRQIAEAVQKSVGTVHKVVAEASEKSRIVYVYMDRENPSTIIDTYGITHKISIVNLTDDMISRAFGIREKPTWEDYEEFLESRCMPRTRYGIKEELRYMGLDSYDPFMIVEKTKGRVYGDSQWLLKMDSACMIQYDRIMKEYTDIRERDKMLMELLKQEK